MFFQNSKLLKILRTTSCFSCCSLCIYSLEGIRVQLTSANLSYHHSSDIYFPLLCSFQNNLIKISKPLLFKFPILLNGSITKILRFVFHSFLSSACTALPVRGCQGHDRSCSILPLIASTSYSVDQTTSPPSPEDAQPDFIAFIFLTSNTHMLPACVPR